VIRTLFYKECTDFLRSRTTLLFVLLLAAIIAYSFYAAVDLYSRASQAAIDNPLYASGFEPVLGIFAPTFGGLFVILSLLAPFLFIPVIGNEKKFNTLPLLAQLPVTPGTILGVKFLAVSLSFTLLAAVVSLPVLGFWRFLGGHLPLAELALLGLGYLLYSLFVIAVSLFAAALFNDTSQAAIFALALIMLSWFVDFGRDMNILPGGEMLSFWTTTRQLKFFEDGILSLQAIGYFLLLSGTFVFGALILFDFSRREKLRPLLAGGALLMLLFALNSHLNCNYDCSESHRHSFAPARVDFLKQLPPLNIRISLEPTDSRTRDFRNDFLRKLRLVKNDVTISYTTGAELKKDYGRFAYTLRGRTATTFSNSEEEIFPLLEGLSGRKIDHEQEQAIFRGWPLTVRGEAWRQWLLLFYLGLLPGLAVVGHWKLQQE